MRLGRAGPRANVNKSPTTATQPVPVLPGKQYRSNASVNYTGESPAALSDYPESVFALACILQGPKIEVDIMNAIKDTLNPLGVAVVIEAQHLCMMMRGVQKQNSETVTSAFDGEFQKNSTRTEFLKLISSDLSRR